MHSSDSRSALLGAGLFSPEFITNPWPVYKTLRTHERIFCSLPEATCVSVKYAEIRTALGTKALSARPPAHYAESALGTTLRDLDGLQHQRLRAVFVPMFRREMVERVTPAIIDPIIEKVIADVEANGGADFVSQVAEPLAIGVACRIMGIPESDGQRLYVLANALLNGTDASPDSALSAVSALAETRDYLLDLLQRPPVPDTLLAHLAGVRGDAALEQDELVRNLILVYAAATKPMAAGLSNTCLRLAQYPKEFAAASDSPTALRDSIVETLRHETPLDLIPRYAKEDLLLGGRIVPEGTHLLLALASGNRDESAYLDPAGWNPRRAERGNLAFGAGRHTCLGRYLALKLLERFVGTMLNRIDRLRLSGEVVPPITGPFVRMPQRLDITVGKDGVATSN